MKLRNIGTLLLALTAFAIANAAAAPLDGGY